MPKSYRPDKSFQCVRHLIAVGFGKADNILEYAFPYHIAELMDVTVT